MKPRKTITLKISDEGIKIIDFPKQNQIKLPQDKIKLDFPKKKK